MNDCLLGGIVFIRLFPWKAILSSTAKHHGFIDPVESLARLASFSQPAEVAAPLELIRAGVVFHARGLINSQAIQHNLDWVWPYWVEKQFDPNDISFVPRSFSITHVNLTHRNWTAVGLPDCDELPIVDPRGLLTPHYDGWSIDVFLFMNDSTLIPSRADNVLQGVNMSKGLSVDTVVSNNEGRIQLSDYLIEENGQIFCVLNAVAQADKNSVLAFSIRPYNPEGISFIENIQIADDNRSLSVNGKQNLCFSEKPDCYFLSSYNEGDVYQKIEKFFRCRKLSDAREVKCSVAMASAAVCYTFLDSVTKSVKVKMPIFQKNHKDFISYPSWDAELRNKCSIIIPDKEMQYIFNTAIRALIIHSPKEVYPGPFTYKRFWFRDAAFILNALLYINAPERVFSAIETFPAKQKPNGYFLSQDGEWDSNGEALWAMAQYVRLTGQALPDKFLKSITKGAKWIKNKRLSSSVAEGCRGLFPAGFSAEHFGPNNFYYWDNYWGVAGLQSAAFLQIKYGEMDLADKNLKEARNFKNAIDQSIFFKCKKMDCQAIPVSPNRRLDTGAVGSLVAGYPLKIYSGDDKRLIDTAEYLISNFFIDGGFFHDLTHSGINPYLTLHIAQTLLRAGDHRFFYLVKDVARLASSTGQWPEAIHPKTKGGCMGDGQHIWAVAEWIMMIRNMFFREEVGKLIFCSGIPKDWYRKKEYISFGPTLSSCGKVSLKISYDESNVIFKVDIEKKLKDVKVCLKLPSGMEKIYSQYETVISIPYKEIV